MSEHRDFKLCFDVARDWEKSCRKFSSTSFQLVRFWFGCDLSHFLAFPDNEKENKHIDIFKIIWMEAHCSNQFIKCRQMWIWILMIHCCKLMGTDESEKIGFHFQGLGGSRYCNTRKMSWPLVHRIFSNVLLRGGACFSVMLLSSWKVLVGKEKVVKDSSLVSLCLSFVFVFLFYGCPFTFCFK